MSLPERLPEPAPLLGEIAQPLDYAEQLLQQFTRLAQMAGAEHVPTALAEAAAQLSGCRLAQLYLLDSTHTRLTLAAEWLDGQPAEHEASLPSDYDGEQLLQYCLCQNRPLSLTDLDPSLHEASFLPVKTRPGAACCACRCRTSNHGSPACCW